MKWFLLAILIFIQLVSNGQATISGKVTDNKKNPLSSASIAIENSYDGATTDSLGNYHFTTFDTGKQIITVSLIGYEPYTDTIIINGIIEKNIELKLIGQTLDAVVISAGSFAAGDVSRSTELSNLDIVTTASANGDITSAIKTLPGAQQVGENEGLFVRGGTANETKYFIDGTLVNNFYYTSEPNQATRGRFNPFLFKGTVFSSGGYSALYGQALSSVLLMESIDLPDRTSASLSVSVLSLGGGIQKLSKNKRSSWGVTYGYSNLDLAFAIVKQKMEYTKPPKGQELDANFRFKTKNGMVKYYGYLSSTALGFKYPEIEFEKMLNWLKMKNLNTYHNISWKENLGSGWKMRLGGSYSYNHDNISSELQNDNGDPVNTQNPPYSNRTFHLEKNGDYINGKWLLEKNIGGLSALRFGNEYNYSNEVNDFKTPNDNSNKLKLKENLFSTFAEADIYLTNKLAARAGIRTEHSQLFDKWNVAPRISLAYKFPDKGQASFAYGLYFQNPDSKYLPSLNSLHFEKATHYILQYQKIANKRVARAEIFYKKYDDLIKASGSNYSLNAINNKGFGDAKGIEIFWRDKKSIKNFDYWISYSYLDTKRDFLNYPYAITPPFSAKHTASLVLKSFVLPLKTQFNASYTFASGRPYYDIYDDAGTYKIRQQGVAKSYNDLSLSINYLPGIGKKDAKSFGVWVFSVSNVLGFDNIYTYNFSSSGKRVAVLPPSRRFLFLGYFVSFGIDRTEDAIDSHL